MDAVNQFTAALAEDGLRPPEIISDGKLHRFAGPDEKHGKKSCWYVLHSNGVLAGAYGDWRRDLSKKWSSKSEHQLTLEEKQAYRQRIEQTEVAVAQERALLAQQAQQKCARLWERAAPVQATHPYVLCKQIKPVGAKQLRNALLIPLYDAEGELHSLQFIQPDGSKQFKSGGIVSGCYCVIGGKPSIEVPLLLCEGWATACSLYEATGYPAVAAMNAGNLLPVAKALRAKLPEVRIIVCADDDTETEGNPGLTKATETARAIGGVLGVPDFGPDKPEGATDFNDLHQAHGLKTVKRIIEAASSIEQQAASVAADSTPDTLDFPSLDERPCWRVYEGWRKVAGNKVKPGVYWHGIKPAKNDAPPTLIDKWICTPMTVKAITRNREDAEYGRLLEILSLAGKRKKWAMPMSMLAGDGNEARAVLLSEGLIFDLNDKAAILRYIAGQFPKETMRAASITGWHDEAFVLPNAVIGADDIWFQASGRIAPYANAGTYEGWRELAALAVGNPLLMLAMSAALAGPLLGPLNIDGGGIHLYGDSSSGKTTALLASTSIWGGSAFKRTWRATANGLEGAGSLHSDTLLALDELGEIDPKSLYESAYSLINGMGKTRANRHGEARQASRWRVFLLSTGELTVAARMSAGGIEAKAGQELRILDIPVAGTYGLFDDLHGRSSGGVLSDEVRNLSAKHYGHAGPRFVEKLVSELRDKLPLADLLQSMLEEFEATEGQERRAARTFALCAVAGELAIEWEIVPWQKGGPTTAALHAFNLWRQRRATNGHGAEHHAILSAISDFIERHSDSRFSSIESNNEPIRDRAGYHKQIGDRRIYLFTGGGLREATKGFDLPRVVIALNKANAIVSRDVGKSSKTTRTLDGRTPRLYHVDPERLIGADN